MQHVCLLYFLFWKYATIASRLIKCICKYSNHCLACLFEYGIYREYSNDLQQNFRKLSMFSTNLLRLYVSYEETWLDSYGRQLTYLLVISYNNSFQLPFMFCRILFMHWEFCFICLTFAYFNLNKNNNNTILLLLYKLIFLLSFVFKTYRAI